MSYEPTEAEEPENLVGQTLSITSQQVIDYALAKKCLNPCSGCGVQDWDFPTHEGKPALLMAPSARDQSVADWFFPVTCKNCGSIRQIGAGYVWDHYFRHRESV